MTLLNAMDYMPPPSLEPFLGSRSFVSLQSGPVGSGKSSAAMVKIGYHAGLMKPQKDGIRRSRAVVVRNTVEMLRDATIPTFLTWFPDGVAGLYMKTDKKFLIKFGSIECEVLFRGLDDANDVRRLLSLEVSFGVLDEFREINPEIFNALQGRVGRYPSRKNGGAVDEKGRANYNLWGATNAPDRDTFWETYMSEPPKTAKIFQQPSALSQEADWLANLPPDYYENLVEGKTEEWVNVYIHNKFGESLSGKPVFRSFSPSLHVAKEPVKYMKNTSKPLIIGMDFGLNPSAVIGQVDMFGRLLVLDSVTSDGMGILRFLQTTLRPLLTQKYPGLPVIVVGDPAGVNRAQTDERSCFDILKQEGFKAIPARTNALAARITAVDSFLLRHVDGKPAILIDQSARHVVAALRGGYRYKIKKSGEMEDGPEKNSHSHVADALQYLCLHADGGLRGTLMQNIAARPVKVVQARGWT